MIDERYVLHRYKATSHAAVVGSVLLGGFFLYDFLARDALRWDLAVVLAAMAITKLGVLAYYRRFD
jgi:hypothetical protein